MSGEFPIDWQRVLRSVEADVATEAACPELLVSFNGELIGRFRLVRDRYLIGRSELSDIVIDDRYVSNHHALLVKAEEGLILVDMKSRNGTLVNSQRIQSRVLRDDDIVSIGHHRIKVSAPSGYIAGAARDLADTVTMKNIADVLPDDRRKSGGSEPGDERRKA